ncbi:MAG: acetylxylan esterase [Pirellulaceae bacterium]
MKRMLLFASGAICLVSLGSARSHGEDWTADPALVAKLSEQRPEFNYDESKVPEYTLPDPLVFSDGTAVKTPQDWEKRRDETLQLFRQHVYGRRPDVDYATEFTVVKTIAGAFGGRADGREVRIRIRQGKRTYDFSLLLFLPTGHVEGADNGARPVLLHINNRDFPTLQQAATQENDFWSVEKIVARQYIAAAVSTNAIDPDRGDGFEEGIRGFLAGAGAKEAEQSEDAWGALSAWGWGASRALDYLETVAEADAKRVAVIGHSRGGKAALWCAAEDPRFAVAYSNDSGCGGAALSRRRFGETVARITSSFPHWFCKKFADYGGKESELPVDQHQLIGLIAPRAVYVASATEDLWADPRGEYLSLIHAAPVYKLLGKEAIVEKNMPAADEPRVKGKTGYHIRSGGHGLTPYDWTQFMHFTDQHFAHTSSEAN